jgi:hypothetical protein
LRFTFGGASAAGPGRTITGYSVPETEGSVACRVWLHLVYVDALIVDPTWKIDSYTVDRLKGTFKYLDATTRYAAARFHEEEVGEDLGVVDSLAPGALSIDVAGFNEIAGLSADRMRSRLLRLLAETPSSEHMDFNRSVALPAFIAPSSGAAFGPGNRERQIELLVPYKHRRSLSPAGPIAYQFSAWATAQEPMTFQRILHRVVECQDTDRVKEGAVRAFGQFASRCSATPIGDDGQPCGMSSTATVVVKP